MHGAENLPPSGNYVGRDDPIGFASIYKKDEAEFYKKFIKERAVAKGGVCDDYAPRALNKTGEER
jgi:hypothetical protein